MSIDIHTVSVRKGTVLEKIDRLSFGKGVASNLVGSGAGVAVTTTVTPGGSMPANPTISVDPRQDATWYTTNFTVTTFDVVLTPRLAANTLAAGSFTWQLTA